MAPKEGVAAKSTKMKRSQAVAEGVMAIFLLLRFCSEKLLGYQKDASPDFACTACGASWGELAMYSPR